MNNKIVSVQILPGYNGAIKIRATSESGEIFVVEKDHAEKILLNAFNVEHTSELKSRQQYARLYVPALQ